MNLQESVEAIPGKIVESIKGLFASADQKFTDLKAQFDALTTKHTQAEADLATAKASLATTAKEATDAKGALAAKDAEIITLKAERDALQNTASTVNQAAAAKAAEIAAAQGIPAANIPETAAGGNAEKEREQVHATYQGLIAEGKSSEAGRFWQANKKHFGPRQ